ncbi:MAG: translation elongation factor Ts [Acidobacteria bacterium]|nr:translation elongation factor Ts [Acidobacteriota bacterium]
MAITSEMVRNLREKTGAGMMECKKALTEADGSEEKAIEILRKSGLASAKKREGRIAAEGAVASYIHMGGKVGVLLEINCETDFVARSDDFQRFSRDVAMHICASEPQFVSREEVPADVIEKEKEIALGQATADPKNANKPANILEKMVQGRIDKFLTDVVLLQQPFVKDQTITIGDLVTQMTAKTGEKVSIRRFTRYKLGEGLEKRVDDFAAEVAAMNQ